MADIWSYGILDRNNRLGYNMNMNNMNNSNVSNSNNNMNNRGDGCMNC